MHDRLPPKGMCSWSHDLFKFQEINSTIWKTVQDIHIVAIDDYYEIVCGLLNGTITGDV